jgi:hypothetical protein
MLAAQQARLLLLLRHNVLGLFAGSSRVGMHLAWRWSQRICFSFGMSCLACLATS